MRTDHTEMTPTDSGRGRTPRRRSGGNRLRLVVLLSFLPLPLSAARPAAASCLPQEPVAASVEKASVVFVGTVVSTTDRDRVAQVRVEEVWKGPALKEVQVRGTPFTAQDNAATSLDRSFRTGVRYLFVPRSGVALPRSSGMPVVEDGLCTATQEYHPELEALRPAGSRGPVHGDAPPVHGDAPPSSDGDGREVPILPLTIAAGAALVVAALVGPLWTLRRGRPA